MTKDEILKLDWNQINDAIAEKVMHIAYPYLERPDFSDDIGEAWRVVEKMSDRYHWEIRTPFTKTDSYWAGLTPLGVTGFNGRPDFKAFGDTAPLAICRAALLAVSEAE